MAAEQAGDSPPWPGLMRLADLRHAPGGGPWAADRDTLLDLLGELRDLR